LFDTNLKFCDISFIFDIFRNKLKYEHDVKKQYDVSTIC